MPYTKSSLINTILSQESTYKLITIFSEIILIGYFKENHTSLPTAYKILQIQPFISH